MKLLYSLFLHLLLPFMLLRLLWRSIDAPAYRRRWAERFGVCPVPGRPGSLWIHAVSVGETQAVEPLVKQFLADFPEVPVTITTTTPTGSERVRKLFGCRVHHSYCPFDTPWAVKNFLKRVRPRILVMVDTEIWPNLLAACEKRKVPTILANARLSESSAARYARLGSFTRETFRLISLIAAQADADADRFIALGAIPDRVRTTGSIKFDIRLPASLHEQAAVLGRQWGNRPVWVGASTHEGEDEQLIEAHRSILKKHPEALLVLVPRHPERFDKVAALCQKAGFKTDRRSENAPCESDSAIYLGDTMGELTLIIAAADIAFVGGSLVPVGGHNILEPAALGVPILFGPCMFNFTHIGSMMKERGAAVQVENIDQLSATVSHWFGNASERVQVGENGRQVVENNRGATERLYGIIEERIGMDQGSVTDP
ncbi:MAG: 3-deoxy-D-manno-octulosonic acid transferase [Gammaproteobacteria bacterium]|nr:3-deoxy-D-manno-octulosonic acid transferase [Gammaproteobacteria bacterium]